jgi:hypothetical protein
LPPWVWRPPRRARRVHRPAAAFNVYKSRAPPAPRPSSSSIFSQPFPRSVARCLTMRSLPPLAWTHLGSSVGLAAAENLDDAAGLKPEPSIYHSGLDALDCRDGDHSSESRRIGRDTIMNSSSAPSPRRRTITILTTMLPGDCYSRGFALALLPCVATWPIEEMPHDDAAGCCLTSPRMNYVSG